MPRALALATLGAIAICVAAVACSSNGGYASGLSAGSACATDYDCQGQLNCAYAIAAGCNAMGVCTNMGPVATMGGCPVGPTVCACTGQTIQVPRCWMNQATEPVQYAGPCVDGGPPDAARE